MYAISRFPLADVKAYAACCSVKPAAVKTAIDSALLICAAGSIIISINTKIKAHVVFIKWIKMNPNSPALTFKQTM